MTYFKYEIPIATRVRIEVFNVLGRKLKTLVDEDKEAGFYTVYWDGIDDQGRSVVSGIYFYHMSTAKFNMTHKMIVVR
jgi:flagellar hook assembly protein FlgD